MLMSPVSGRTRARHVLRAAWKAGSHVGKYVRSKYNEHRRMGGRIPHPKKKHKVSESKPVEPLTENGMSNLHSGVTCKIINLKLAPHVKRSKGEPYKFQVIQSGFFSSVPGVQTVGYCHFSGTASQWTTSTSGSAAAVTLGQSELRYFDMNPNEAITGSGGATPFIANAVQPGTDRLVLQSEEIVMDFVNLESVPATVVLYCFRCTKFTSKDVISLWNDALSFSSQGVGFKTVPGAGAVFPSTPGKESSATPLIVPKGHQLVSKHWKLVGKTVLEMAAAGYEKVKFNVKHNFIGRSEVMSEDGNTFVPGTFCIMAVCYGSPILDNSVTQQMTYASTKVGFVTNSRKVFKPYEMNSPRVYTNYGFASVPTGASNAALKFVNVIDGNANVTTAA